MRRLPGRFIGHRGARESEWSWERQEENKGRPKAVRWPLTALVTGGIVAGIAAFAFGLFLVLSNGDGNAAPPVVTASRTATPADTPTRGATPTGTPAPTRTPAATPTPAPTPSPAPTPLYSVELFVWSENESSWGRSDLGAGQSGYEEGDSVPFLLRIGRAAPGDTYRIEISYDCLSAGEPAFDYLAGADAAGDAPLLRAPGPGTTVPDSSLGELDDLSIDFDAASNGALKAWGAVFSAASRPNPTTACTGAKTVNLSLLAQSDTILLAWTGHLSAPADWGPGKGASDATPFSMRVDVNDEAARTLTLLSGAVSR